MGEIESKQPFLTIVTRCFKRPGGLRTNRASVRALTDQDLEQIFIVDEKGAGLEKANQSLWRFRNHIKGKYVFILDDDDFLIRTDFIERLKAIVSAHNPDLIMVKMISVGGNIIPDEDACWRKRPVFCKIGTSCVVVRSAIWKKHIKVFGRPSAGDYYFIKELFKHRYPTHWLDLKCSKVGGHGKGKPEPQPKKVRSARIAFVTMAHNRDGARLGRLIESVMIDQEVLPQEFIVVDTSTNQGMADEIRAVTSLYGSVRLIRPSFKGFSKSRALNIGIQSVSPGIEIVGCVDMDFIFGPGLVSALVNVFENPASFVMVEPRRLPEGVNLSNWVGDWDKLCALGKQWARNPVDYGPGALQAASLAWWKKVRGYDEVFSKTLGGMDNDTEYRAERDGLHIVKIPFVVCPALHQWHQRSMFKHKGRNPHCVDNPPTVKNRSGWGLRTGEYGSRI